MISTSIFASVLLALAINWWVLRPLFAVYSNSSSALSERGSQLFDKKERCLQVLRDLQLDYATRKLGEADYLAMKAQVSRELAEVLAAIDSLA